MATNTTTDQLFINRTDSGFPAYLDFTTLRTNAINYLGPITASYWTDYNIHDPGITTLEALLYALMDLGYRVNFPIADLLTPAPGSKTKNIDFFTPAQILGGNPFTIIDYRKKLMDLTEVRNAWLDTDPAAVAGGVSDAAAVKGVYTVYLELEMDPGDFGMEKEWEAYRDKVVRQVMGVLQAHRNLCEDFSDPVVLTKRPVTIQADIELADGASPAQVYQDLIKALYNFFSPAPPYYTLGQLVQQGVPLDQVFTGRPYEKWPSHGFILDTDLPERPTGRTPIYLSAVYHQFLETPGVKTVRKLSLDTGELTVTGPAVSGLSGAAASGGPVWTAELTDDMLPVLNIAGSSFRWYRGGQLLAVDLSAYTKSLEQEVIHGGKVFYPAGDLDVAIPGGRYLEGMGQYYSIQNDYPQVYGIGPGGLPGTASAERQSQALQLKGYLLFFDQLLADYLAQLGNIQALFSMSGAISGGAPSSDDGDPEDEPGRGPEIDPAGGSGVGSGRSGGSGGGGSTYFAGDVSSVPGLTPLLRFPASAGSGTLLVYPVAADDWTAIAGTGSITCSQLGKLSAFTFTDAADRDVALAQLALSLTVQTPTVQYINVDENQLLYAISDVGNGFVLLSQSLFPDVATASRELATVLYIGGVKENYNLSVLTGTDGAAVYSFSLVQTAASYMNYVQTLLENPTQYTQRRTAFLQHLMDRFAESFTDFALLSAGFLTQQEIADKQVGLMEQFLGNFPALSGNRGQAYNYTKASWNTTNTSGLEKRFAAYSGIGDKRRHWLCSFEVGEEEKQCQVAMALEGKDWLVCPDSIPAKSALPAATDLFRNMGNAENYQLLYRKTANRWAIGILFYGGYQAVSVADWPDEVQAAAAADQLAKMRQLEPGEEDIEVNQFEYRAELLDADGKVVRLSTAPFNEETAAWEDATKRVHRIDDAKSWQFDAEKKDEIGKLIRNQEESAIGEYLDIRGFNIAIKHDIPHKPDHCRFTVADGEKTFRFASTDQFSTDTQGRAAAHTLLFYLTVESNYVPYADQETDRYRLSVEAEGRSQALSEEEFADAAEAAVKAGEICRLLRRRLYNLRTTRMPLNWKFSFYTGLPGGPLFGFRSDLAYPTVEEARAAVEDLYKADKGWELRKTGNSYAVAKVGGKEIVGLDEAVAADAETALRSSVEWKNSMRLMQSGDETTLNSLVRPDAAAKAGGFVYRLTDKNRPRAFHPLRWKTQEEAEAVRETLIAKGRKGYLYPEFCLGGDNVYLKETAGGGAWHFRIKCRNDYFTQLGPREEEWTLFESIAGYPSADAAQQAFQDNYLTILQLAMDRVNFGERDPISWTAQGRRKAVVFVPEDLQEAMNKAGLNTADELVKAAKAYPIRKKERYVFTLMNDETGETDWESAGAFANAQQAHVAFDYFRLLLNAGGNYFIDQDDEACAFRLGLREVLAESTTAFPTAEAAWTAVEGFISVAQSTGGFHPEKQKDGTWGYFVAGAGAHAQHPCRYETEQQRDDALQHLYNAAQGFPVEGWFSGTEMISLSDVRTGKPVAQFPSPAKGVVDAVFLNLVLDMADSVWTGQFFEDEIGLYVPAGGGSVKIRPVEKGVTRDKWEDELLHYIAYFPVTRMGSTYQLEMKLPGFAALPGPWTVDKDCGCPPETSGKEPLCYAAWVGMASYQDPVDAWKAYLALLPLLDELSWYRSVHGKPGDYGVELYKPEEIVAHSVQTYAYAEMAARGMGRAADCINMEGIDLVEHLLLRPGKGVKPAIPMCPPASALQGFSTQPGVDGYSFIITVFLPAWPQRFRKKENRQVLERLLQEETPAHILLRILWLAPMDMCRWESQYKNWLRSLVPGKSCGDYSADEWMKMLFAEPVACLEKYNDEWLSEINLLYCWKDRDCADTSKWNFDAPKTGSSGGGIQFKPAPAPMGQSVGAMAKLAGAAAGGKARADVADKMEDAVDKAQDAVGKVEAVADKVQEATDKMNEASGKLQEVKKIVEEVVPIATAAIPGVGPVVPIAEEVIPMLEKVGLWSKILHKGVDVLEGVLGRLKNIIEKGKKK